jgi:hypothetical protein
MVFTKQEVMENYPLKERIRLEKAKSQNSVLFWINELINQTVQGAEDVPGLIAITKNLTEQLESVYEEMEKSGSSGLGDEMYNSLTDQIVDLYKEKELLFSKYPSANSIDEIIQMMEDLENQLIELYKEKETG